MSRPLGYRILRMGLKLAGRAANDAVDRVVRREPRPRTAWIPRRREIDPRAPVEVVFEGLRTGRVERGATLLEAAAQLDVDLSHYCGGNCSCGTCRVEVLEGRGHLSRPQGMEEMVLGPAWLASGHRLACQTQVLGRVRVRIPEGF